MSTPYPRHRGLRTAAPLKRGKLADVAQQRESPRSPDRGSVEAICPRTTSRRSAGSPRSPDRGSVEAPTVTSRRSWRGESPRSPDRGSVEAVGAGARAARRRQSPRSPDRGSVEASTPAKAFHLWACHRGLRTAAPLKPLGSCAVAAPSRRHRGLRTAAPLKPDQRDLERARLLHVTAVSGPRLR